MHKKQPSAYAPEPSRLKTNQKIITLTYKNAAFSVDEWILQQILWFLNILKLTKPDFFLFLVMENNHFSCELWFRAVPVWLQAPDSLWFNEKLSTLVPTLWRPTTGALTPRCLSFADCQNMTFQVEIKCQGRFLQNAVSDKLLQRLMKISSQRDSCSKIWNYETALSLPVNIKGGSVVVVGEAGGEVINIKIWEVRWRTCRPSASIV